MVNFSGRCSLLQKFSISAMTSCVTGSSAGIDADQGFMQDHIFARHNFGSNVQLFWKTFAILYPINHTTILILSYLFQMSIFVYNPTMPIQKRSYIMLQCKKNVCKY